MDATAKLTNYRQSPRKVRLVADLMRGKSVPTALAILSALPKRAALPMEKLLRSAIANAQAGNGEGFIISKIEVNQGLVLKRFMPRARGSAAPIRKKSCHVNITVSQSTKALKAPKVRSAGKSKKAVAKDPVKETIKEPVAAQ